MSNQKNVTRQVRTTAPYTSSTNASLLRNVISNVIDGVSLASQIIGRVALDTKDYYDLEQAQDQGGNFVSLTDKVIYPISPLIEILNPIKEIESDIGVSYNYLSDITSDEKYDTVLKDYENVNTKFTDEWGDRSPSSYTPVSVDVNKEFTTEWGDRSYAAKIKEIESDISEYKSTRRQELPVRKITDIIQYSSNVSDITKSPITPPVAGFYGVRIIEDRDSYSALAQGEFSMEKVEINVLQNVDNFSFGTSQEFTPISPRGSQTPLRFYNNNPGRSLHFAAKFHQQEYPLDPLLSIAEKAQYLARPYKHGDYSLIPKLVRVEIPGRVFRGYLTNVSVTYTGSNGDYRTWDRSSVQSALSGVTVFDYDPTGINTSATSLANGQYNTNDSVYYGLAEMAIDFDLAIVEEINLTLYSTHAEKVASALSVEEAKTQDAEFVANRDTEWQVARNEVNQAKEQIYTSTGDTSLQSVSTDSLIYVNKGSGEVVGIAIDANGEVVPPSDPDTMITLEQYIALHEVKDTNPQNSTEPCFHSGDSLLGYLTEPTHYIDALRQVLQLEIHLGYIVPNQKDEESEKLKEKYPSLESLMEYRRVLLMKSSSDNVYLVSVNNLFTSIVEPKESGLIEEIQNKIASDKVLKRLLSFNVSSFDDAVSFLTFSGFRNGKGGYFKVSAYEFMGFTVYHFSGKLIFYTVSESKDFLNIPILFIDESDLDKVKIKFREDTSLSQKEKDYLDSIHGWILPLERIVTETSTIKEKYTIKDNTGTQRSTELLDRIASYISDMSIAQAQALYTTIQTGYTPFYPYEPSQKPSQNYYVYDKAYDFEE